MEGEQAAGGKLVEFLLESFTDTLDSLQIVLPCSLNDIAVKRLYDFRAIAVGPDLKGVLAFQFEKEGDLFEDLGKMVAGNFGHERVGSLDRSVSGGGGGWALGERSDSGCRGWEEIDYFMTKSEITMR